MARDVEDGREVRGNHGVPILRIELLKGGATLYPRVVDENVRDAVLSDERGNALIHGGGVLDVERHHRRRSAWLLTDRVRGRPQRVTVAAVEDHRGSGLRQPGRQRQAEAAGRSGDQGQLAGDVELTGHAGSSPRRTAL